MEIKTFDRKPFSVEAVQVTRENMKDVAEWCGGKVDTKTTPTKNGTKREKFVKVPTTKPMNEKQTQAFVTDWVLLSDKKFKVYTHRAFVHTFQEQVVYTEADAKAHLEGGEVYPEASQPVGNVFENAPTHEPLEDEQEVTV